MVCIKGRHITSPHYNRLHYITLDCMPLCCIASHNLVLHYIAWPCMHCIVLHARCVASHFITSCARCLTLHHIAFHSVTLQYITSLHYNVGSSLQYITLQSLHHYITPLHCNTIHHYIQVCCFPVDTQDLKITKVNLMLKWIL